MKKEFHKKIINKLIFILNQLINLNNAVKNILIICLEIIIYKKGYFILYFSKKMTQNSYANF